MTKPTAPDALLLLATGCAHCPVVLEGLSRQLKLGRIGRLEAVNIEQRPEIARSLGVRSVPWIRIGAFELEGTLTMDELAEWVERASSGTGYDDYFSHLLETGRADRVAGLLQAEPRALSPLIGLLEAHDTPMAARIGVGVVLEELEGSELLRQALPDLIDLARSRRANLRADAAHFLGLTRSDDAFDILSELQHDDNPDVREIAADSLRLLSAGDA